MKEPAEGKNAAFDRTADTAPDTERAPTASQQAAIRSPVPKHEFIAELVALVRRTSEALLTPSVDRFPVSYKKYLTVNVLLIHDDPKLWDTEHSAPDTDDGEDSDNAEKKLNAKDAQYAAHADARREVRQAWHAVRRELRQLAFTGQQVEVNIHHVSFYDCELCVAALTHSLKSHTSNVLADGLRTQVG